MDDHIQLNAGNVILIVTVSMLGGAAALGGLNWASKRNIPMVSRAARGTTDFLQATTNKEGA